MVEVRVEFGLGRRPSAIPILKSSSSFTPSPNSAFHSGPLRRLLRFEFTEVVHRWGGSGGGVNVGRGEAEQRDEKAHKIVRDGACGQEDEDFGTGVPLVAHLLLVVSRRWEACVRSRSSPPCPTPFSSPPSPIVAMSVIGVMVAIIVMVGTVMIIVMVDSFDGCDGCDDYDGRASCDKCDGCDLSSDDTNTLPLRVI